MRSASRSRWTTVAGVLALAFLYVPVVVLAVFSLNDGGSGTRWQSASLRWYRELFEASGSMSRTTDTLSAAFSTSLRLATAAAVVGVALAALTAIGLRGARRAVALPLIALWSLPIVLPDVVLGVSWAGTFRWLGLGRGFAPLLLSHATMAAAFALVVVQARMASLEPTLIEAARDLGATRGGALRHVVLPHLKPAIVAGLLLGFTLSFDDYMVTLFLYSPEAPTLPVSIAGIVFRPQGGQQPVLNAIGTLSLVGTLAVGWVALRFVRPGAPS